MLPGVRMERFPLMKVVGRLGPQLTAWSLKTAWLSLHTSGPGQ